MAVTIELPGALQAHARGSTMIVLDRPCASVGDALDALAEQWPGVLDRVMTEQGELRPHVNIFIDDQNSRFIGGLGAPVPDGSTILILPAVSGG
jgi:molybdopterin converting factor small subunit